MSDAEAVSKGGHGRNATIGTWSRGYAGAAMYPLRPLARRFTDLTDDDLTHVSRLVADWQMLADLNFADLLLFAPVRDGGGFIVLGQVRPFPAQTVYPEDMIGSIVAERPRVAQAIAEGRIVREGDPEWRSGTPIREEVVPVPHAGRVIAAISSEQNLSTARTPSKLELSYLQAAGDLALMIADGDFPFAEDQPDDEIPLRVGDGFMRLDAAGIVTYVSPNGISAYRRLGVTANLVGEPLGGSEVEEEAVLARLLSGHPVTSEIEANGASVRRRFLPIIHKGSVQGALGFVRDTTDLRRRDRMLVLKDATIREIHHRVKNNLQTVASLLRMQARRVGSPDGREALLEAIRRISSIALVHETLSHESTEMVEFDQLAARVVAMVGESVADPDRPIAFALHGSAGEIDADTATPLALVLNELCQNAVDHAFASGGGSVTVTLERRGLNFRLTVADNGRGLPDGFTMDGGANLGLQIVRTLVESELGGQIRLDTDGGTRASVDVPLGRPS